MFFSSKIATLAGPSLLLCGMVAASPLDSNAHLNSARYGNMGKRQQADVQDESDPIDIAANLNKLRSAVNAPSVYLTGQPTNTWTQVSIGPSPSFTVFTAVPSGTAVPPPSDTLQGNIWNVDHILELQVIGYAFQSPAVRPTDAPTSIPADVWTSVTNAVFGTRTAACTAIASAITVLENLEGIPSKVNGLKQQVFTGAMRNGNGAPSDNTYYTPFGPAVQKMLKARQSDMFGIIDSVGDQLAIAGNNTATPAAVVKAYFTPYAQARYTSAIDFLSTWTGKPYPSATSTSASAAAITSAPAVSCENAADPQNTCAAIADGDWCECNNDGKTYAAMSTGQPCAYTTLPPTTSFNCATTPAPSPTNAVTCSQSNGVCNCTDGSHPTPDEDNRCCVTEPNGGGYQCFDS